MPEAAIHVGSGKVRELFELDAERLLLVASDRISTFDVVLPTEIPDKGRVLTGLSAFWFTRTRELVPSHLLALVESGLERDAAYRLVQGHALRAQEEECDFPELVRADTEIASRVDLDSLFDLDWYTRNVDTVFERLTALDRKEEPVHA